MFVPARVENDTNHFPYLLTVQSNLQMNTHVVVHLRTSDLWLGNALVSPLLFHEVPDIFNSPVLHNLSIIS